MKIDAHIHFTPPSIAENLEEFAEKEPYWGLLVTPDPVNHTEQGWATPERMIEDMDKAGIDSVVLLGEGQTNYENAVERNTIGLELMQRWPNRVIGFATILPRFKEKGLDELKRCLDDGMRGLGEIGHYSGGFSFEDPDFLRMVEACIQYDIPLLMHCNEEVGHFYLGKSIRPLRHYYRLICRYPELKLILAHWGGGLFFYEIMPEVRQKLKNVWYDSAGGPLVFPTDAVFRAALNMIDHRKILYGSDYPLLICPEAQHEPDFRPFLQEIDALGMDPQVYADIMGNNTARLLGLMEDDRPKTRPADKEQTSHAGIITELASTEGVGVEPYMAVSLVAETWPESQAVFEKYGIPWKDSPVPFWEPIAQAAAARGFGPKKRQQIMAELNEAIKPTR